MNRSRMSLNQITFDTWDTERVMNECKHAGVSTIGAWRHKVKDTKAFAQMAKERSIGISSLCRGGWFSAPTAEGRRLKLEDNKKAIEECCEIGSPLLVIVAGPAYGQSMADAREHTAEALAELATFATPLNIKLGLEPLHPMYAGDRSVVVTLGQANDIVSRIGSATVGVVIDVFHVWWDPAVYSEIQKASGSILGYHVSDWPVPLPDILMGREVMGNGVIEFERITKAVQRAGFVGPIEVEIFNKRLWDNGTPEALAQVCAAFERYV